MTVEQSDRKPGPFAALRRHYHETRHDHRPVPVVVPFVVVSLLAVACYLLLDSHAAAMQDLWPDWIRKPARFLTDIGKSWWIITLTVILIVAGTMLHRFATSENRRKIGIQSIQMASYVLVTVSIAGLISNLVKRAIGRPRPEMWMDHGIFSFNPFMHDSEFESFPSGHATTSGALFAALALLFPRFRWPLLLIGLYLAVTRVFVGAHYPSDVMVGFGWGIWFAFFMAVIFARHGLLFSHGGRLTRLGQ